MDKCVEEPERRVSPGSYERLIFLFPGLRQAILTLLPFPDSLQCILPPPRPGAAPAYDFSRRFVTDVFQAATLKKRG
jgi:hypothetical protein